MSSGGQTMSVSLPGGSTLSFTLRASGGPVEAASFPTYGSAYLGNGSYTGVAGQPAMYQSREGTTTDLELSDIVLTTPTGETSTAFSLVGADAETTDEGESIRWNSSNTIYSLTGDTTDPGIGNACSSGFTGVGTREVTCTADTSNTKSGTPILASHAPETFSQRMIGTGRQAVGFGVLLSQIELNKEVESRFTGDSFEIAIDDEEGNRLYDAETGATGVTATTEEQTVIATDQGATFEFSERAVSGDLERYDVNWSCLRNGEGDPTLPSGAGVGLSAQVHLGIGDYVSCTIVNQAKPTSLLLQKQASAPEDVNGNGIADTGDRISYTFEVTNTGDLPIGQLAIDDSLVGAVTCPADVLEPGQTVTCSADAAYAVTIDDQNTGAVENTATASGVVSGTTDPVVSNESSTSTPVTAPAPNISLTKTATPHEPNTFVVGQEITYHFAVRNTGNVPLEDVEVAELEFSGSGTVSAIECPTDALPAHRSMRCTATYTLTQQDVDATQVTNGAQATGLPVGGGDPVLDEDSAQIPGVAVPAIGLAKTVSPSTAFAAGDSVEYAFHITNLGNVTLADPRVDELLFSGTGGTPDVVCPSEPAELAPGAAIDCSAVYELTQADVDSGVVDNTAVATASPPEGVEPAPVSEEASAQVVIPGSSGITLQKSTETDAYSEVGQEITYSFAVTNTGNRTLNDVAVDETEFSGAGEMTEIICPETSLAGGASMTCSATYAVQQRDIDAGTLNNSATAMGLPAGSEEPVVSPPSDVSIPAVRDASISLEKTADPAVASVDDEIRYTFTVANTGNVSIVNPRVSEVEFSGAGTLSRVWCPIGVLEPGGSVDCVAHYSVVEEDREAGEVVNTAVASATPPPGVEEPVSNESTATVVIENPMIELQKTANRDGLTVGDTITYSFAVTNTGNVPLTDVAVDDDSFSGAGEMSSITCPEEPVGLEPAGVIVCTATYEVEQSDVDAGSIENTAIATGVSPEGVAVSSNPSSVEILQEPVTALGLVKSADPSRVTQPGDVVRYTFTVTNLGTVTVRDPHVEEQEFSGHGVVPEVVCPDEVELSPGDSVDCSASYTVVAEDLTGEPLYNVATAKAVDPREDEVESPPASVEVGTVRDADLVDTGVDHSSMVIATLILMGIGSVLLLVPRRRRDS
ncbi:hypothetical protein K8P10_000858 [Leucobacter sp. Psy1]|nr:hypothetical protein K8P10_000858 [Leucobacter sp. Psy1]